MKGERKLTRLPLLFEFQVIFCVGETKMVLVYIVIAVAFIDTFSQLPIISPFVMSTGAARS